MKMDSVLMCAGCGAPTPHVFAGRRPQAREHGELPFADCIYECRACGRERAWGNEPRVETALGRRFVAEELAHALDEHGMRRTRCPSCDGRGLECHRCDDDGETWMFDTLDSCGATCPLAGLENAVDE